MSRPEGRFRCFLPDFSGGGDLQGKAWKSLRAMSQTCAGPLPFASPKGFSPNEHFPIVISVGQGGSLCRSQARHFRTSLRCFEAVIQRGKIACNALLPPTLFSLTSAPMKAFSQLRCCSLRAHKR
jgi:hypothetical protein